MFIPYSDKEYKASKLIFDVTEDILISMEDLDISKKELAEKLGKNKSYISQMLSGTRNMTLKTLSDICYELQIPLEVKVGDNNRNIYHANLFLDIDGDDSIDLSSVKINDYIQQNIFKISEHPNWGKAA